MRAFKLGLVVSLIAGVAAACSSSSSSNGGANDAGAASGATSGDDTGTMNTCSGATCGAGKTCCTVISLGALGGGAMPSLPAGMCVAAGSCSNGISTECGKAADCGGGQVCCFGQRLGDASAASGPLGALSGLAAGGLSGLFAAVSASCQTSCMPGQQQLCATDTECAGGVACQGLGGDGGAAAGAPAALTSALGNFMFCAQPMVTPDAGGEDAMSAPDATSGTDSGGGDDGAAPLDAAPGDAASEAASPDAAGE
jgi:hypothetical protein